VHLISGNHDDTQILAQIFGREADLKEGELYYEHFEQEQQIIFLDSAVGKLSNTQKSWLIDRLKQSNKPALIFIHHPPAHANLPHMDNNYPLQDRDEIRTIFINSGRLCHVFCGHYHIERIISAQNLNVFITPSCYIQISDQSEEFKIDHTVPAWRKIEIENEELRSSVVYCL
jgi:Icc protein